MKAVKKVLSIFVVCVFFAFAIVMSVMLLNRNDYGVTQFGDTTLIVINNNISTDKYKEGDLVLVKSKRIDKLKVGDEIFSYRKMNDSSIEIDFGKIGEIYVDEDVIAFENGSQFTMSFVAGVASTVYSGMGTIFSIILSTWVFLFLIVVPCFLLFLYQIYALIVEIKYGSEE